jgi:hypothetical protein
MLSNDLITLLAQHDNDPVTVAVNEHAVDVENVTEQNGSIVIALDPKGVHASVSADIS